MNRLFAGTVFDVPPRCEVCNELTAECKCTWQVKQDWEAKKKLESQRQPPEKQACRVVIQKRKGGRVATVVEGLTHQGTDLNALFKKLQGSCGAGGTVKSEENLLELQGDHVAKVQKLLTELGYKVKK
jgi:translation initiation factor 1